MYSTPYRPYVGAHKNIWEPIILGFQMHQYNVGDLVVIVDKPYAYEVLRVYTNGNVRITQQLQ